MMSTMFTDYEDDLIRDLSLAAELGKGLLDRNQELQSYIYSLQQIIAEKNDELILLENYHSKSKEILLNKLKHCEQLDTQNNELENQVNFYRVSFEREQLRNKDLNASYDELYIKYIELQDDYQVAKIELKNLKQYNMSLVKSSPRKRLLNRCLSECRRSHEHLNSNKSLKEIYQKWSQLFDSFSRKRLIEYKDEILLVKTQNETLNEQLRKLELNVIELNNLNRLLNVDLDELKCANNEKDEKIEFYERLVAQQGLDTNNNLIKLSVSIERSISPVLRSSLDESFDSYNDYDFDRNAQLNLDHVSLYNECNEYYLREEQLKKSSIEKVDSQVQCDSVDNLRNNETAFSNYKNIFKQIYDTLNSSKLTID